MLQRILVGLDGSMVAESILPFVTTLARSFNAEVRLIHVVHVDADLPQQQGLPTAAELTEHAASRAQAYLDEVRERLVASGLDVSTAVASGDAASEIVKDARDDRADLIALATHGRSAVMRLLYGSVAEKVLHTTSTPLLLVRPLDGATAAPRKPTHVLVPLDGSALAESALATAEILAAGLDVPIVLLRAVEMQLVTIVDPVGELAYDYARLIDELSKMAKDYADGIARTLSEKGMRVSVETPAGDPVAEIQRHAEQHPGTFVVLATHGRSGLVGGLVGSVARQVLRADVPTVVVPAAGSIAAAHPRDDHGHDVTLI